MYKPVNHVVSLLLESSLTKTGRKRLRPKMENWLLIHEYLRELEANLLVDEVTIDLKVGRHAIEEIKRMLELELTDRAMAPRWHVIERLHNRLCTLRKKREQLEIRLWLESQKRAVSRGI